MKLKIFYSWQSDLPKDKNLNFIEKSIKRTLKDLQKKKPIPLNIEFDKATRGLTGSPDITESIFTKIATCNIFIADISIINHEGDNLRKTPNPNVLVELGFAARALGWERIICIFNSDFGNYNDLPFDLRNRRVLNYSCKTGEDELYKKIESSILEMNEKGGLTDKILDFLKKEIDREILGLLSHILLIVKTDDSKQDLFAEIRKLLNYSQRDFSKNLNNNKVLGFYLFKLFNEYETKIYKHINQALSSQYYNREILNSLIEIYEWFAEYDKFRTNFFSKLFIKTDERDDKLFVLNGADISSENLSKRYLLMEKIDEEKGIVRNFGDFASGSISGLTNYFIIKEEFVEKYCSILYLLIKSINKWLDNTNNEFIVDFTTQFRVKKTDGEWL